MLTSCIMVTASVCLDCEQTEVYSLSAPRMVLLPVSKYTIAFRIQMHMKIVTGMVMKVMMDDNSGDNDCHDEEEDEGSG